jgi:hypothetical protein
MLWLPKRLVTRSIATYSKWCRAVVAPKGLPQLAAVARVSHEVCRTGSRCTWRAAPPSSEATSAA